VETDFSFWWSSPPPRGVFFLSRLSQLLSSTRFFRFRVLEPLPEDPRLVVLEATSGGGLTFSFWSRRLATGLEGVRASLRSKLEKEDRSWRPEKSRLERDAASGNEDEEAGGLA
jgi:hypothetical protein